MKSRTFILITFVVLALGCTGNNSPSATAGADITEFVFDTTSATDKDTLELTLKIENVGAKTIDGNSRAWIYNAPFGEGAWRLDSINGDKSNKAIIGDGEIIQTKDFFPFDTETGTSGAIITKDMFFTPPATPIGMKENYEFNARLCYPYRTTSSSTLSAVSPMEFRAKPDTSEAGTINSAGPLRVELKSDSVIRSGGRIPLPFIITNVGGGYATSRKADADCTDEVADTPTFLRNRARLTVLVDGEATDCTDTEIALDASGKAVAWCNIASSGENPKQESHVTATLMYNYFATKSAKIEVKGVLGGLEPGAAAGGGVVVATLVRDICEKAEQKMDKYERAIPVCAIGTAVKTCLPKDLVCSGSPPKCTCPEDKKIDVTSFNYPSTDINVLGAPLAVTISGTVHASRALLLKDALGSRYDKATIRTLNTHDLTAKDLKLDELKLSDIDSWFISSQYTNSTLLDRDNWFCNVDSFTDKCPEDKRMPYVKPLGLADAICNNQLCEDGYKTVTLVSKKDAEKGITATHRVFKPKTKVTDTGVSSINSMDPAKFFDQPIYGLKITSINGVSVSEITKNTVKISEINLEDFYLKYLIDGDKIEYKYDIKYPFYAPSESTINAGGVIDSNLAFDKHSGTGSKYSSHTSLLDHIKCDSTTPYGFETHAFCVVEVERYHDQPTPLPKFSGTSSSECSKKCKSLGTVYNGACNSVNKADNQGKVDVIKPYECKGRSIIGYGLNAGQDKYGCSGSDFCLCYRTEKADMTSAETLLLCQK